MISIPASPGANLPNSTPPSTVNNWEFGDCCEEAFNILVRCELEEGFYHYIALGRLVGKSQEPLRYYQADSFSSLLRCPRFKTKTQKRNEILNKLV